MIQAPSSWQSARHKTALRRTGMSKPVRIALEESLLEPGTDILDFGCGHGEDVRRLGKLGFNARGWDPVFQPDGERSSADVVNLGYVVNVIEDQDERARVLREAWGLARTLLIISARSTLDDGPEEGAEPYRDGVLTRIGSFQKFYDQPELRAWIYSVTQEDPMPAAPGVFLLFRNESQREAWRARRYHRAVAMPRVSKREQLFNQHQALLEPLMAFISERGRSPRPGEVPFEEGITEIFGTLARAFRVIQSVTGETPWASIAESRRKDLLVWLALCRFHVRPPLTALPQFLQWDIRDLFGTYSKACAEADRLLMSLGDSSVRDASIQQASFGKLMPKGLYVHARHVDKLSPELRLYEGCARAFVGEVAGTTLIKFHRDNPQISYLAYDDFEKNPHPELINSIVVPLDGQKIKRHNYKRYSNRFILHRKESFLPKDDPLWEKFHSLTVQEERLGLFEDPSGIGTRLGWEQALLDKGFYLRAHRLCRIKQNEH